MTKIVKVGKMPGRLQEVVVNEGASIRDVLNLAELDASGFDVQVDGVKISDIDSTAVTSATNLIVLVQKVKGNSHKTVKVGKMPGRLSEFAVETNTTTVAEVLEMAELDASGFDVQVDGVKVDDIHNTLITDRTNLIVLVQKVKGNK